MSHHRYHVVVVVGLLALTTVALAATPQGGVFIPRNGRLEGCLGKGHVVFDTRNGGTLAVVTGAWPDTRALAGLDAVVRIKPPGSAQEIEARQSFDANPEIDFLEEGSQRIGLRVKFRLYD